MGKLNFCFIRKNTPEIQEHLKKLGIPHNDFDEGNRPWIAYNHGLWISVDEGHDRLFPEDIDCGDNEDLFIALASLVAVVISKNKIPFLGKSGTCLTCSLT